MGLVAAKQDGRLFRPIIIIKLIMINYVWLCLKIPQVLKSLFKFVPQGSDIKFQHFQMFLNFAYMCTKIILFGINFFALSRKVCQLFLKVEMCLNMLFFRLRWIQTNWNQSKVSPSFIVSLSLLCHWLSRVWWQFVGLRPPRTCSWCTAMPSSKRVKNISIHLLLIGIYHMYECEYVFKNKAKAPETCQLMWRAAMGSVSEF